MRADDKLLASGGYQWSGNVGNRFRAATKTGIPLSGVKTLNLTY